MDFWLKCCNWIRFLKEMRNIEGNGKKKEEKRNSVGLLKSIKNRSLLMSVWFSVLWLATEHSFLFFQTQLRLLALSYVSIFQMSVYWSIAIKYCSKELGKLSFFSSLKTASQGLILGQRLTPLMQESLVRMNTMYTCELQH